MPGRRAIRRCRSLLVGVIAVLCYLTVGFTAMRLLLGGLVLKVPAAQAVGLLIWFVMLMVGGAGPPREVLTAAMGYASDATPLWYAVQMMHQPWLRRAPECPGGGCLVRPSVRRHQWSGRLIVRRCGGLARPWVVVMGWAPWPGPGDSCDSEEEHHLDDAPEDVIDPGLADD